MSPAPSSPGRRTLRIGHVLASPFPALRGTQGMIAELLRAQLARGHEVHLWAYAGELGGTVPEGLRLHRARRLPAVSAAQRSRPGLARPMNDLALLSRLCADPAIAHLDLLHGHNHEGGLAALIAGRVRGLPVVHQVHGALEAELQAWAQVSSWPAARLLRGLAPGAGRLFDHRLPGLADACLRLRPGEAGVPGTVLPMAISRLQAGAAARGGAKVKLPAPGPWVVYAGNLDPYQDLPQLFAVQRLLQRRAPAPRLLLVSHDPPEAIEAALLGSGIPRSQLHVAAAGTLEVAARWIAAADLMLVPRRDPGGLPLKIQNAIGLALPVVTTRAAAAGLGEAQGVVATGPEARSLAGGVEAVLDDARLRARLRAGARAFALAHSWVQVAEACEAVYAQVLT